jgi:hypothetical protein
LISTFFIVVIILRLANQYVQFESNFQVYVATEFQEAEIGIIHGTGNEPKNSRIFRNRLLWTAGKFEKGAVLFLRHGPLFDRDREFNELNTNVIAYCQQD